MTSPQPNLDWLDKLLGPLEKAPCTGTNCPGCGAGRLRAAIANKLESVELEARIDELNRLVDENDRAYGVMEQLGSQIVRQRIADLESHPPKAKREG